MWVVPIAGDNITTTDNVQATVKSYSNFKSKGPCVYVESDSGEKVAAPIYFFDIKELNGVQVEYPSSSKILNAMGFLKRKLHLPQKHDVITVHKKEHNEEEAESAPTIKVKVRELKLHNRNIGLSRGLVIIGEDDEQYSLGDILDIKRVSGDSYFDQKKFMRTYDDYVGYTHGKK